MDRPHLGLRDAAHGPMMTWLGTDSADECARDRPPPELLGTCRAGRGGTLLLRQLSIGIHFYHSTPRETAVHGLALFSGSVVKKKKKKKSDVESMITGRNSKMSR
jgi:hypothetical protein